ncbi:MAG TPA: hypothetical protein DEA08_20815 [Planctomycetes bacterium]|nr:hypothetical protein [Planctomycetota bacterium]
MFRFQPVHRVHAALVAAMSARADEVVLGVGSADTYDARNPFSYEERVEMLAALGHDNLVVVPIPDLHDGPRWGALVRERLGPLERLVAANGYVRRLLGETYRLSHPLELIPPSPVSGSRVRAALARGDDWQALVPASVAALIEARGLDRRVRREFGAVLNAQGLAPPGAAASTEENDHVRVG